MNELYYSDPDKINSLRDALMLLPNPTERNTFDIITIQEILDDWETGHSKLIQCILSHNSIEE